MILMDTCAIIWDALEPSKLTQKATKVIENADKHHALIISDISLWEISMLIKRRRLEVDTTATNFLNLFLHEQHLNLHKL